MHSYLRRCAAASAAAATAATDEVVSRQRNRNEPRKPTHSSSSSKLSLLRRGSIRERHLANATETCAKQRQRSLSLDAYVKTVSVSVCVLFVAGARRGSVGAKRLVAGLNNFVHKFLTNDVET